MHRIHSSRQIVPLLEHSPLYLQPMELYAKIQMPQLMWHCASILEQDMDIFSETGSLYHKWSILLQPVILHWCEEAYHWWGSNSMDMSPLGTHIDSDIGVQGHISWGAHYIAPTKVHELLHADIIPYL